MNVHEPGLTGSLVCNRLLASVPKPEFERLRPWLSRVTLATGRVLHERASRIEDVFFVEEGLVSLMAGTVASGQVEVGLTGRDGLVGTAVLLNPDAIAVHRAMVQIPGAAYRISAASLRQALEWSPTLRDRCLRYVQMLMAQTAQAAACNAKHDLGARLARWLLMSRDRVDTDTLPLTQDFLRLMLGVRRAGVSVAMAALQGGGLVSQTRGRITVHDRAGLEAACCECYHVIRHSHEQILGVQ